MDLTYAYAADITKSEVDENGDLIVYGVATSPDIDLDGDRCDPAWLKTAMPGWFEWQNVREMHQPIAAGVGMEMTEDGDSWFVKSKCIDEQCAKKLKNGVYKGYSIGIKNGVRRVIDDQPWIVAGEIVEISYVDRPCNPTAKLAIAKMAGAEWEPSEEAEAAVPGLLFKAASVDVPDAKTETAQTNVTKVTATVPGVTVNGIAAEYIEKTYGKPPFGPADEMKALALIGRAAKAAAGDEQSDVDGAAEAIAVISRLIESECSGLANGDMGELDDINLLIEAACALKWFMGSEQREQDGTDEADMAYAYLAASADIEKRKFTAEERRQAANSGAAMPGGRYPIETADDLHNAIHAVGRGKGDHEAIRRHIIARAKKLGLSDQIPADWTGKKTPLAEGVSANSTDTIELMVKAAVAEASKAAQGRIEALEAELTKVKATPIPGGPVLAPPPLAERVKDSNASKAAQLRRQADSLPAGAARDIIAYAEALERAAKD